MEHCAHNGVRMKMRELLNSPSRWAKDAAARDKFGSPCSSLSADATSWCIVGAASLCYPLRWERREVLEKITAHLDLGPLPEAHLQYVSWQDAPERTFDEVHSLLEKLDI